ncbi:cupin domain-containing protein [Microbacterium gorillae]|uniref:cupin domain-containing protein n=1 Tax=Microbacterium gorillae TaxID=1231063 RepID=UPI00058ADE53|nr:cupin domain-containing protein [Microbacterium gorillae]
MDGPIAPNELHHFNVFTTAYPEEPELAFNGVRASSRVLHTSADGRVFAGARRYPDGADYTVGPDITHHEIWYVVEGTVVLTPEGGDPVTFVPGEFISYPAGMPVHAVYSPGSHHLAVFFADHPLVQEDIAPTALR